MLIYAGHKWPDNFHYTAQGQNLVFFICYQLINNVQFFMQNIYTLFYAEQSFHGPQERDRYIE